MARGFFPCYVAANRMPPSHDRKGPGPWHQNLKLLADPYTSLQRLPRCVQITVITKRNQPGSMLNPAFFLAPLLLAVLSGRTSGKSITCHLSSENVTHRLKLQMFVILFSCKLHSVPLGMSFPPSATLPLSSSGNISLARRYSPPSLPSHFLE